MTTIIHRYRQLPLLAALFCCCLPACKMATRKITVPVKTAKNNIAVVTSDREKVQANITCFLKWYKANYRKANSFPLLGRDVAGNFTVDKRAYKAYLSFLNSSGLIAPRYLDYWATFFRDKSTALKKEKIKSDIPDGFDLDLVLITQEPEMVLDKIDSLHFTITSMNDSVALVGVKLPADITDSYEFEMYKDRQQWQVGYISTPNYD